MAKEIQAVQTSKGRKVAKILVSIFTPIICVAELAAIGTYAYMKIEDIYYKFESSQYYAENKFEREIKVFAHQETQLDFNIGSNVPTGTQFNRLGLYDANGTIVPISFLLSDGFGKNWHINSEGVIVPNTTNDIITKGDAGVRESFYIYPSKMGNFTVRLEYK